MSAKLESKFKLMKLLFTQMSNLFVNIGNLKTEDAMITKLLEQDGFESLISNTFVFNKTRTTTVASEQPSIDDYIAEYVNKVAGL